MWAWDLSLWKNEVFISKKVNLTRLRQNAVTYKPDGGTPADVLPSTVCHISDGISIKILQFSISLSIFTNHFLNKFQRMK